MIHLNAEFQRIAKRDKKAFLSDQCKETKENNRMGKTRDLFKKTRDTKGTFHASSVQFSRSVVSDSLWPHESQHSRPPCPWPPPWVHSDSRPSSQGCHPIISSSVVLFSSCPQSLPSSKTFPVSQLFTWGASVRSIQFLSFIVPIFAWNVPLLSLLFLKRSLVFPILLFSSISLHWSLRKSFLSLLAILWNSAFKWVYLSFPPLPFAFLLFSAIC